MKTKRTTRTTEITVERDEVHVIMRADKQRVMWCAECGCEVEVMTSDEAMTFAGVSGRTVAELVESREAHFTETPAVSLLICVKSLGLR